MKCYCGNKFANQQTYLDTVCKARQQPCKKRPPNKNGLQCTYTTPKCTVTFSCNGECKAISVQINNQRNK